MSKTLEIRVKDAYSNGDSFEGVVEIFFSGQAIIPETKAKIINLGPLLTGMQENITNSNPENPDQEKAVLISGCGIFGCCPALFVDIKHDEDQINLTNLFWWDQGSGEPLVRLISAHLSIDFANYREEVNRLEAMWYKCREYSNKRKPTPTKKSS